MPYKEDELAWIALEKGRVAGQGGGGYHCREVAGWRLEANVVMGGLNQSHKLCPKNQSPAQTAPDPITTRRFPT